MSLATYKRDARAHINNLKAENDRLKQRLSQEEARADMAERQARQMAAERNIWKFQAEEALAELKSRGAA